MSLFRALSWAQRLAEGTLNIPIKFIKNAGATTAMRYSGKGLARRGRGLANDFTDFGDTLRAIDDNRSFWKTWHKRVTDPNRTVLGRASTLVLGGAGRTVTTVGDVAIGVASDVAGAAASVAGTVAGAGLGLAGRAIAAPFALAGYGAVKAAKPAGRLLARRAPHLIAGTAERSAQLGIGIAKEGYKTAAGAARLVWNTRNNPVVGNMLVGGAIVGGLAYGNAKHEFNASMGLVNPDPQAPANMLNRDDPSPAVTSGPVQTNAQLDTLGASGDLVFALNNLRRGGMM